MLKEKARQTQLRALTWARAASSGDVELHSNVSSCRWGVWFVTRASKASTGPRLRYQLAPSVSINTLNLRWPTQHSTHRLRCSPPAVPVSTFSSCAEGIQHPQFTPSPSNHHERSHLPQRYETPTRARALTAPSWAGHPGDIC